MDQTVQQIEAARRKREEELLLLLLVLIGHAYETDPTPEKFVPLVTANLMTHGVQQIAHSMALIHLAIFMIYASQYKPPKLADVIAKYIAPATVAAQATVDSIVAAVSARVPASGDKTAPATKKTDVQADLKKAGLTNENSFALALGVERNIVAASNAGAFAAAVVIGKDGQKSTVAEQIAALEHVSVLDLATTTICRERDGLTLSIDSPYWLTNTPPLHWNCRSVIQPAKSAKLSTSLPTSSPAPGFGTLAVTP